MTSNDPDAIRADIERTQAELSEDVDALVDKVSPSRVKERQTEKVRGAVGNAREKVFGAADDVKDRASGAADEVRDRASG
ncbi:DUF3618 domain-containing protein, partial [Georgenia sp. 10Sc9-8]|nr:DUF3618 domain-containing protein [Georgenia halotolerans]